MGKEITEHEIRCPHFRESFKKAIKVGGIHALIRDLLFISLYKVFVDSDHIWSGGVTPNSCSTLDVSVS